MGRNQSTFSWPQTFIVTGALFYQVKTPVYRPTSAVHQEASKKMNKEILLFPHENKASVI
jgi:hypothetical protein